MSFMLVGRRNDQELFYKAMKSGYPRVVDRDGGDRLINFAGKLSWKVEAWIGIGYQFATEGQAEEIRMGLFAAYAGNVEGQMERERP